MRFDDLKLSEPVLRAVHAEGYETPTPIQVKAIPHVLEGKDLMGCAQTGTGKTAAFALPILSRLAPHAPATSAKPIDTSTTMPRHGRTPHGVNATHNAPPHRGGKHAPSHAKPHAHEPRRPIRVLVLTPTRELAVQIGESFETYGRFCGTRCGLVYGGVGQGNQERMLRHGVDVLVATPGRLLDLMGQGLVDLSTVEVFVLDEADRMLDMGFIHDIRKVIARLPSKRQTLMFSATMPSEIRQLAGGILKHPEHVAVAPVSSTADRVEQRVYFVDKAGKGALLLHLLESDGAIDRALVFTRTKHGADKVAKMLDKGGVEAEAIHGNKSQNQRQRALNQFKQGRTRVLVATDIAARGLDIDALSHVFNYDLPNEPESYVHRIGRTGRAGLSGMAVSFCSAEERGFLKDIERVIGKKVPVEHAGGAFTGAPSSSPHSPQTRPAPRAAHPRPHVGGKGPAPSRSAPHARPAHRAAPAHQDRPAHHVKPTRHTAPSAHTVPEKPRHVPARLHAHSTGLTDPPMPRKPRSNAQYPPVPAIPRRSQGDHAPAHVPGGKSAAHHAPAKKFVRASQGPSRKGGPGGWSGGRR